MDKITSSPKWINRRYTILIFDTYNIKITIVPIFSSILFVTKRINKLDFVRFEVKILENNGKRNNE